MRRLRAIAFALVAAAGCKSAKEAPKTGGAKPVEAIARPDAAPVTPPTPAPTLEPVTGDVSAANGKALFAKACASCHGDDATGHGPKADRLRHAPTNLTTVTYLCKSTDGRPVAVPADIDVEGAMSRGAHQTPELAALDPAQRRSLTLYVKTLAKDFAGDPQPLSTVPPESMDDAGSRERGRMLYLSYGCPACHGAEGKGDGDANALALIKWNDRPIEKMPDLTDQDAYLCGSEPERVYRTIALGEAMIMPPYGPMAELTWRPAGNPEDWAKKLEGKIAPEELAAYRQFTDQLPTQEEVRGMTPAARKLRAGGLLWDLVHYVRSL